VRRKRTAARATRSEKSRVSRWATLTASICSFVYLGVAG
jgi:hypothetical protein